LSHLGVAICARAYSENAALVSRARARARACTIMLVYTVEWDLREIIIVSYRGCDFVCLCELYSGQNCLPIDSKHASNVTQSFAIVQYIN